MQSTKATLLLLGLGLLAVRCVREASIDLPELPTRIVAISHFLPGQPVQVEVSLSQTLTDAGDPDIPANADVSISVEGIFLDKLYKVTNGTDGRIYWESRDTVKAGVKYALSVRITGYDEVEAVSAAPEPVVLGAVSIDTANMRLVPLSDGKLALRVPLEIRPASLPANGRYFAFGLQHEIEVFELVNGQPVPDEYYQASTKFLADGRTLSLVYDTPEKVVLVNENLWNGNNEVLTLDALIPFNPENERPRHLYLEWRTLSEEFYRYHLSLARQGNNLPLNDPDALYNNIQGGYGNFSGYSFIIDTLSIPNPF
ncbi:MAG: DUF4249 domain-containing protein [Saprospiraceae bacterium]|nr:DUF4249 domain-containing protein [Saprospiraceae bacterium]